VVVAIEKNSPEFAILDVLCIERRRVIGINKIAARSGDDVHANNEDRVRRLLLLRDTLDVIFGMIFAGG
jgi:hypothetical protein